MHRAQLFFQLWNASSNVFCGMALRSLIEFSSISSTVWNRRPFSALCIYCIYTQYVQHTHAFTRTCANMLIYLLTFMHKIHTYLHAYVRIYIHLNTYIPTYVHSNYILSKVSNVSKHRFKIQFHTIVLGSNQSEHVSPQKCVSTSCFPKPNFYNIKSLNKKQIMKLPFT